MRSISIRRLHLSLTAAACLAAILVSTDMAAAEGAVAVALPAEGAQHGFAYGIAHGKKSADEARTAALEGCRNATEDEKLQLLCEVLHDFSNHCAAIAVDPEDGTPGAGLGIADTQRAAEADALAECEQNAGAARKGECQVSTSYCDKPAARRRQARRGHSVHRYFLRWLR
jgi:hypothetical protein